MDENTDNTPEPTDSGVAGTQAAATHVVTALPESLKQAGTISIYPAADSIARLRDTGGIRGDAGMIFLHTMVQGVEHRALVDQKARIEAERRAQALSDVVSDLKVQNAQLMERARQAESDKDARTLLLTFGGIGVGIAVPLFLQSPSAWAAVAGILSLAILVCGLGFPFRSPKNSKDAHISAH